MPREILPENQAAAAQSVHAVPAADALPVSPAQTDLPLDRDALAGALPAWDLLPASPFVRRVQ